MSSHGIAQREFEAGLEGELQQGEHSSVKLDNRILGIKTAPIWSRVEGEQMLSLIWSRRNGN